VKIGQAVADLDPNSREPDMSEVARDANVPMPPAAERWQVRILGPLADNRRGMKVDIRAHQLDHERDRRRVRDQIEERRLAKQSWSQVELIVLGAIANDRLVQERMG
jgi:hypothetical protein